MKINLGTIENTQANHDVSALDISSNNLMMIPANNELIKPSTDFIKSGLAINLKSINIKK